jgi:uncharacterized protein YjiS (DUF1127 family)
MEETPRGCETPEVRQKKFPANLVQIQILFESYPWRQCRRRVAMLLCPVPVAWK